MRVDTMLKLGSLAFGVAQDERVRELATMIHKGAKRRGIIAPLQSPASVTQKPAPQAISQPTPHTNPPRIPFAPGAISTPQSFGGLEKFLTVDNAKKAFDWAGIVKELLVK